MNILRAFFKIIWSLVSWVLIWAFLAVVAAFGLVHGYFKPRRSPIDETENGAALLHEQIRRSEEGWEGWE